MLRSFGKYGLIDIDVKKIAIILFPLCLISYFTIHYFGDSIPNSINFALSFPLALLTSFLYEFFIGRTKIYDEEAIDGFLNKIEQKDTEFIKNYIAVIIRQLGNKKIRGEKFQVTKELLLLCYFLQSSFIENKWSLEKPENVKKLYDEIKSSKKGFQLKKDYGVDWDNLAFLYEENTHYLHYNYKVAQAVKLDYKLTNEELLIRMYFLSSSDFWNHHPYTKLYADLYYPTRNKLDINQFPSQEFSLLYKLLTEIKDKPEFTTLVLFICMDIYEILILFKYKQQLIEIFPLKEINTVEMLEETIQNFLNQHPVVRLFSANPLQYISKNDFDDFDFENSFYAYELSIVYMNKLNYALRKGNSQNFQTFFQKFKKLKIRDEFKFEKEFFEAWKLIYQKFYNHYKNQEALSFEDISFSFTGKESMGLKAQFESIQSQLERLKHVNAEERRNIIHHQIFDIKLSSLMLKTIPLYYFNNIEQFSQYLNKE